MIDDKYWVSNEKGILKETLPVLNEYLLSIKLENKAEATVTKYHIQLERFLRECRIPLNNLSSNLVHD